MQAVQHVGLSEDALNLSLSYTLFFVLDSYAPESLRDSKKLNIEVSIMSKYNDLYTATLFDII